MNDLMLLNNVIRRLKHLRKRYPNRYANLELTYAIDELETIKRHFQQED